MRVRFTPSARVEFLEALACIQAQNPAAALRFRRRAERVMRRLERFPDSGRRLPEFFHLPHRELIARPHRFFYRVERRTVWVVAVWHGAQRVAEPSP